MRKLLATTALTILGAAAAHAATPMRTSDFINSLGVNVHVSQGTALYSNTADVAADMAYLGAKNMRDNYQPGRSTEYKALSGDGLYWDFIIATGGSFSATSVQNFVNSLNTYGSSVVAVEGPNEINNWPVTWSNGDKGTAAGVDMQTALYADVHADASLPNASVYYFTGWCCGNVTGPNPATTAGLADFDTNHPYPNVKQPPQTVDARSYNMANEAPGYAGPVAYTEGGYDAFYTGTQAMESWTLDMFADSVQEGVGKVYFYELMQESKSGDTTTSGAQGFFNNTGGGASAATPMAVGFHNQAVILADTGATAATFTPAATVNYTLTGMPSTARSLTLQKSTGETDIVVWNDAAKVPATSTAVSVALGASYGTVSVYDPTVGTAATQSLSNVSTVTVGLTDHPLIIAVAGSGTVTPPPPPPPPPPVITPATGASDTGTAMSTSYANDAAAAAGGVAIGQFYRNGSAVEIRVQ